jgi:hypothetical protein
MLVGVALAHARGELFGDFRAFYCSGELARVHAFSYAESAIAPCESLSQPGFFTASRATIVPSPLPGYLVALFVPLSLLQFPVACVVWAIGQVVAAVAALWLLARSRWVRFDVAIAAAMVMLGVVILPVGEMTPTALLGIVLVMVGCERDSAAWRAAGLAVAFVEPQIALGVAAALCARRRGAFEVLGVAAALLTLSVIVIGWSADVAYVRDFLPAHVAAELPRAQQYTLSWALRQLGASPSVALWVGRVVFLVALVAAFLSARFGPSATRAVAAGAALALAFGPFVHLDHMICALPAAFLVARASQTGAIALTLLALPLTTIFANPLLILFVPLVTYWLLSAYLKRPRVAVYGALASVLAALGFALVSAKLGFAFRTGANDGGAWATYVAQHNVVGGALIWIVKTPLWAALLVVACAAVALATQQERSTRWVG